MSLMQVLTTRDTFPSSTTTPYAFLGNSSAASNLIIPDHNIDTYFPGRGLARLNSNNSSSSSSLHQQSADVHPVAPPDEEHFLGSSVVENLTLSSGSDFSRDPIKPTSFYVDQHHHHNSASRTLPTPSTATRTTTTTTTNNMNNLQHVAQQSRREKLRIPGSLQQNQQQQQQQPSSSPQHSEHSSAAAAAGTNSLVLEMRQQCGDADQMQQDQNLVDQARYNPDMLSVYNNPGSMLAPDQLYAYGASSSDLLSAVSGKNQSYLLSGTDPNGLVYPSSQSGFHSLQQQQQQQQKGGGNQWATMGSLNGTHHQLGAHQFHNNSNNNNSSSGIPATTLLVNGLQGSAAFGSTTGRDLGAYFNTGSGNAQEAMQLYLMNAAAAGFSGFVGGDASGGGAAGGSMVFIPGGGGASAQNLMGSSSQVTSVSGNSPTVGGYNQTRQTSYANWKNSDELVFMPSSERAKSFGGSQQDQGGLSDLSAAAAAAAAAAAEFGNASMGGSQQQQQQQLVGNSQLSLSLSSQQHAYDVLQQSGLDSPGKSRTGMKLSADLSHFRRDFQSGGGGGGGVLASSGGGGAAAGIGSPAMSASFNIISSSRYLKSCQQLLEEVCSVGKALKQGGGSSLRSKSSQQQGWTSPGLTSPTSAGNPAATNTNNESREEKEEHVQSPAAAAAAAAAATDATKDAAAAATTNNSSGSGAAAAAAAGDSTSTLTAEEKQELETKKSKLVAMLQEVDRRYRQYYDQMQVVISSFDAVAGVGAATPYTALALQAMSRYFRCLKDAITGQISLACKSLGEEDISKQITTKSPTSRLRFIDQQIRQQRAFQQLGMLNQHAWRPQRGLPERSVSILRAWLFEHFLHPYPKDADKQMLARQTGLTRSQVSNWFINARVRLWKPMVEEMYQEETREHELDVAVSRLQAAAAAESDPDNQNATSSEIDSSKSKLMEQFNVSHEGGSPGDHHYSIHTTTPGGATIRKQNLAIDSSSQQQLYEDSSIHQLQKKSRYTPTPPEVGLHDHSTADHHHLLMPSSAASMEGLDLKPESEESLQRDHHHPHHLQLTNAGGVALHHHHFGSYTDNLNHLRFGNGAGFRYNVNPGAAGSGVSLTLGLQHSDQQQAYLHGGHEGGFHHQQQQQQQQQRRENALTGAEHDFSSLYENASAAAGLHEGLNYSSSRKHMESQLLHDFVPT